MDSWSQEHLRQMELNAEQAKRQVDMAREHLSLTQARAAEAIVGVGEARERLAAAEARATNQFPPTPTINAPGNRYARPARFSVIGAASIAQVEALSRSVYVPPHMRNQFGAPAHGVLAPDPPERSQALLRAYPPIRRSTRVAVVPTYDPRLQAAPLPPRRLLADAVIRKPLTNPCSICYEPFEGLHDATFCRASCGQNFH
jgi:hypothetical protein